MKRLALLALLLAPASGFAVPVVWTLQGSLIQGGSAGGSFVYDADTQSVSDVLLATDTGSISGGLDFTSFAGESSYGLIFWQAGASNAEPTIAFQLNGVYFGSLTNAGGLVTVNPSVGVGYFAEFACGGAFGVCSNGAGTSVSNWVSDGTSNTLMGRVLGNTDVSEPGTLALLGAACFAMFFMTRRRRAELRR
jgi:hypothetical protein